jgi:predicted nucleotidyltransferase
MDASRPLSVVTPTLDGDVLAALARADGAFSGRQVHRLVGRASEEGVRKALERLRRQGIVTAQQAGSARLYQLNRAHLAAPHIEGLARLREELTERLGAKLASWNPPPVYAAIFGSFARHAATPDSDLDLFLVRARDVDEDDPAWRQMVDQLTAAATAWTGNDARVLEYGEHELREVVDRDPILDEIGRHGIRLLGSPTLLRPTRSAGR